MGLWQRVRRVVRASTYRTLALVVAVLAGIAVYSIATNVFPYHSVNDDEGVYLLQAAMLLEGQLFLYPPGELAPLVRPWFFVVDEAPASVSGVRMYPKYAPVVPALFALGKLAGSPRLVLGAVAVGNAILVYALATAAFDRKIGLVAVTVLTISPLFLVTSSVFLPYAPTTLFNLGFAYGYVRATRIAGRYPSPNTSSFGPGTGSLRRVRELGWAVVAGMSLGLAGFARPYTAILFAAPFLVHAVLVLGTTASSGLRHRMPNFLNAEERAVSSSARRDLAPQPRRIVQRYLGIAVPTLGFVLLRLAYNAHMTGDPLLFPFEAFAPNDGLGFGERSILGYTRTYTPALAAETTSRLLIELTTDWLPAGPFGAIAVIVGLTRLKSTGPSRFLSDRELRLCIAGLVPSVILGNAYFWGTLNGLTNGLIDLLGPYYHFDLLLPVAVFGAGGVVRVVSVTLTAARRLLTPSQARGVLLVLLIVSAPIVGITATVTVAEPLEANLERTDSLATAYQPFERTQFQRALVYTPDPYGNWQQHPFQYLRNDPGFDGQTLYVLDAGPTDDWRAYDATNRTPYRFTYRGEWANAVDPVDSVLTRLRVLRGVRVTAQTVVGVPQGASLSSIRLETAAGTVRYQPQTTADGSIPIDWQLSSNEAEVTSHPPAAADSAAVPLPAGPSEVDLVVTFVGSGGASVTYRQELTVDSDPEAGTVRVFWPPETRVCRLTTECGREGTWVGPDGDYVQGVSVQHRARPLNATG